MCIYIYMAHLILVVTEKNYQHITYKMTVEDDHEYKLCPGAEWRNS